MPSGVYNRTAWHVERCKSGKTFLPINHAAFDALTPEARYWAGFLMADGCLSLAKRRRKNGKIVFYKLVSVQLKVTDCSHLFKLRRFLHSGHKITVCHYKTGFGWTTQARFAF